MRFHFSMLYTITISHLYFYFSFSLLDVLKESRIGGFHPPPLSQSHNPFLKTRKDL